MAEEMVLTPGGLRPKSLVHFIEPSHGLILEKGVISKINLITKELTQFPEPPANRVPFGAFGPGRAPAPPAPSEVPGALPDGWQTYAWWDSGGTPITSFSTTWLVPQPPSTTSGQIIFLFNGIQNTGSNFGILQPVLQWGTSGAGGGNYWAVASWYVTSGGQAFHTTLVPVNAGSTLVGVMTQTAVSSGQYSYSSTFQGISNTTLPVQNIAPLHWANETLECYSLNQCSDLPASDVTAMVGINILTGSTHPNVGWTPVNAITNCGQHTVLVSNANPAGEVDLWYRAQTGWHHNDLTNAAGGAPTAASDPDAYMFNAQGTQHVNYRGSDNHIHELWWDNSGWHHNDLTNAAGGTPVAAGDPTGYMFDAAGHSARHLPRQRQPHPRTVVGQLGLAP